MHNDYMQWNALFPEGIVFPLSVTEYAESKENRGEARAGSKCFYFHLYPF